MKKLLCLVGVSVLAAVSAYAETFTWYGTGGNRWSYAENWTNESGVAQAPMSATTNDLLFTDSPARNSANTWSSYTFRSMTFDESRDTAFSANIHRGNTQVRNITMDADSGNATITVAAGAEGNVTFNNIVVNNGFILNDDLDIVHNGTGELKFNVPLKGAGSGINKSGAGTLQLGSALNSYNGDTIVSAGRLTLLDDAQLLYEIGVAGVNNSLAGSGEAVLLGDFRFDLAGASTTLADSWQIVDVDNLDESFEATFSVLSADTNSIISQLGDVWTIAENGVGYEFSESTGVLTVTVPEPATLGLIAAFGGGILFIRRRFMI